jgi:3-dehydrosphinganine reductase
VSILARRQALLDETLAELESLRAGQAQHFRARSVDVADWEQTRESIHSLVEESSPPDLLLNVAGFCHPGYFEDLSMEVFRDTMDVDYFGTVHATKAVVPIMMERRSGHIVNFSSVAGFYAIFGFSPYCAAKFAVCGFSESLRQEMRPYGVRVSVVYPPTTDTPGLERENQYKPLETQRIEGQITPQTADQVARVVLRGVERRQRYILPGLDTKLFFFLAHLPPFLTAVFHWYFIDRIISKAHREQR